MLPVGLQGSVRKEPVFVARGIRIATDNVSRKAAAVVMTNVN